MTRYVIVLSHETRQPECVGPFGTEDDARRLARDIYADADCLVSIGTLEEPEATLGPVCPICEMWEADCTAFGTRPSCTEVRASDAS